MSINKVIVSGNLTREPELRQTASGMPVLSFGIAVNDRRKNPQTDEWENYPNFIDCTMFGSRGEALSKYVAKGSKVVVEGKIRWSQWEKDGQKRSKIEIVVDELELMNRAQGDSAAQNAPQPTNYAPHQQYAPQNAPQRGYQSQQYQATNYGQQQYMAPQQAQYQQVPVFDAASNVYDEDIPF